MFPKRISHKSMKDDLLHKAMIDREVREILVICQGGEGDSCDLPGRGGEGNSCDFPAR